MPTPAGSLFLCFSLSLHLFILLFAIVQFFDFVCESDADPFHHFESRPGTWSFCFDQVRSRNRKSKSRSCVHDRVPAHVPASSFEIERRLIISRFHNRFWWCFPCRRVLMFTCCPCDQDSTCQTEKPECMQSNRKTNRKPKKHTCLPKH